MPGRENSLSNQDLILTMVIRNGGLFYFKDGLEYWRYNQVIEYADNINSFTLFY